jgi:iron complex outermembrane receptor protein
MMWGGDIGDLDVVVAGQFRSNSRLGWDERPVLANSGLTVSSNSPGNWSQPVRGADGQYTGAKQRQLTQLAATAQSETNSD